MKAATVFTEEGGSSFERYLYDKILWLLISTIDEEISQMLFVLYNRGGYHCFIEFDQKARFLPF